MEPQTVESAPAKKAFHIPSLDGMRTVAFLTVFVAHAGLDKLFPGGFGVTIFFFLSGYLITTLIRREVDRRGHLSFKRFYLRRVLRIWPPFYLVLGVGLVLTVLGVADTQLHFTAVLAQFLHVTNYKIIFGKSEGGIPLGTGVYWSLAVEEHFYLLFPLLYFTMRRRGLSALNQGRVLMSICMVVLVWRCILVFGAHVSTLRTYYATDTRIDSILFGCIMGVLFNPVLDPVVGSERLWKRLLFPAGVGLILFSLLYRQADFRETFRYSIQGLALFPIFYTVVRFPDWPIIKWLNFKWIAFTGSLTYSLYLVHFTVLLILAQHFPKVSSVVRGGVALVISFVLAYAIFRLVETPFAKLRRSFEAA